MSKDYPNASTSNDDAASISNQPLIPKPVEPKDYEAAAAALMSSYGFAGGMQPTPTPQKNKTKDKKKKKKSTTKGKPKKKKEGEGKDDNTGNTTGQSRSSAHAPAAK